MGWRVVGASVPGTSHVTRAQSCADACEYRLFPLPGDREILLLVVADGAGSAPRGDAGAKLACQSLLERAQSWASSGRSLSSFSREDALEWITRARRQIEVLAATSTEAERGERDFACTLLAALADESSAIFFQVGDGGMVRNTSEGLVPVFWPESGEYANCTYFLTDEAVDDHVRFATATDVEEIALFTDGVQRLALRYADRTVHQPFFLPMLRRLRQLDDAGTPALIEALREFLDSAPVNERTDDDKTLLLATRRHALPESSGC